MAAGTRGAGVRREVPCTVLKTSPSQKIIPEIKMSRAALWCSTRQHPATPPPPQYHAPGRAVGNGPVTGSLRLQGRSNGTPGYLLQLAQPVHTPAPSASGPAELRLHAKARRDTAAGNATQWPDLCGSAETLALFRAAACRSVLSAARLPGPLAPQPSPEAGASAVPSEANVSTECEL